MIYLMLAGIERFLIEFLRPNARILLNLSEAQLISLVIIAMGFIGWRKFSKPAQTSEVKQNGQSNRRKTTGPGSA